MSADSLLPKRSRGRPSPVAETAYREQVAALCALILEIRSTMDFAVGSRGWCYILERHGLGKGDFDDAQKLINACRKSGDLPLDICAENASRETIGLVHITEKMRKNLEDLSGAVGWSPENLVIIRFGLNAEFINRHRLTWIDNLETSSGQQLDDPDHSDHDKRYVQDYIAEFGVRKCEANALVVEPEVGRALCRDAILEHTPVDALERYERKLDRVRKRLRRALRERVA